MTAGLAAIEVPGDATDWETLGFAVVGDTIALGNGAIRLGDAVRLVLDDASRVERVGDHVDGVPLATGPSVAPLAHPNGAVELDHLVLFTDSLERTSTEVAERLGLPQRRVREVGPVRQAFHRFADTDRARGCIIEIVERADATATSLWGVVVNVSDLDAAVAAADGLIGEPREAVQPGRRIATVSRAAGLSVAVALMTP